MALTLHSHLVVDEADEMLHALQDGFNLELIADLVGRSIAF
jgi:hypothetical protein